MGFGDTPQRSRCGHYGVHMADFAALAKDLLPKNAPSEIVNQLANFIPIANHSLLSDSLREVLGAAGNKKGKSAPDLPKNFLERLHKAYNRRIAEMSRLYPLFHIVESSYRSFVARAFDEAYGTKHWWKEAFHIEELRSDPRHHSDPCIAEISGRKLSADVSDAVHDFSKSIVANKDARALVAKGMGTQEVIEFTKLSDLENLLVSDWSNIKGAFRVQPNGMANFREKFGKVRAARNRIFHHRDVSNKIEIFAAAEEVLNLIGVHLKTSYDDCTHLAISPNKYSYPARSDHHFHLPIRRQEFSVTAHFGEQSTTSASDGTCTGEALIRYVNSLKASKLTDLHSLQVQIASVTVMAATEQTT